MKSKINNKVVENLHDRIMNTILEDTYELDALAQQLGFNETNPIRRKPLIDLFLYGASNASSNNRVGINVIEYSRGQLSTSWPNNKNDLIDPFLRDRDVFSFAHLEAQVRAFINDVIDADKEPKPDVEKATHFFMKQYTKKYTSLNAPIMREEVGKYLTPIKMPQQIKIISDEQLNESLANIKKAIREKRNNHPASNKGFIDEDRGFFYLSYFTHLISALNIDKLIGKKSKEDLVTKAVCFKALKRIEQLILFLDKIDEQSYQFIQVMTYIDSNIQTLLSNLTPYDEKAILETLSKHIEENEGIKPSFVSFMPSGLRALEMVYKLEHEENKNNLQWTTYVSPHAYFELPDYIKEQKLDAHMVTDKNKEVIDFMVESFLENVQLSEPGFIYTDVIADIKRQFELRKEQKIENRPLTLLIDTSMLSLGASNLSVLLNEFESEINKGSLKIISVHSLNKYSHVGLDTLSSGFLYMFSKDKPKAYGSGFAGYNADDRLPQMFTHMVSHASKHLRSYGNFAAKAAKFMYSQFPLNGTFVAIDNPIHQGENLESILSATFSEVGMVHQYADPEQKGKQEEHYMDPHLNKSWGFLTIRPINHEPYCGAISPLFYHFLSERDGYGFAETVYGPINSNVRICFGTEDHLSLLKKFALPLQYCKALAFAEKTIDPIPFEKEVWNVHRALSRGEEKLHEYTVINLLYLLEPNILKSKVIEAAQNGDLPTLNILKEFVYFADIKTILNHRLSDIVINKQNREPNNKAFQKILSLIKEQKETPQHQLFQALYEKKSLTPQVLENKVLIKNLSECWVLAIEQLKNKKDILAQVVLKSRQLDCLNMLNKFSEPNITFFQQNNQSLQKLNDLQEQFILEYAKWAVSKKDLTLFSELLPFFNKSNEYACKSLALMIVEKKVPRFLAVMQRAGIHFENYMEELVQSAQQNKSVGLLKELNIPDQGSHLKPLG